jgi:hypothetical protein
LTVPLKGEKMLIVAIIVGFVAMHVLAAIPVLGPIGAGAIASLLVKDMKRSVLAGFLSGVISGIFAGIIFTFLGGLIGALAGGLHGGALGGILGAVIGGGIFISTIYFGLLGAIGGALGSKMIEGRMIAGRE